MAALRATVDRMALLYPGLHADAAKKRHLRYAQALVDAGMDFGLLVDDGRADAQALTGEELLPTDTGLRVTAPDGTLAAVVVVSAVSYDNGTALFIRALATAPEHRSRGIATVLLGMVPQVLGQAGMPTRALLVGMLPEALASFAHRAGFAVLEPGEAPPFSFGGIEIDLLGSRAAEAETSCWAYAEVA